MRCSCGEEIKVWQGFLLCAVCNRDLFDSTEQYEDEEVVIDYEYSFQRMV